MLDHSLLSLVAARRRMVQQTVSHRAAGDVTEGAETRERMNDDRSVAQTVAYSSLWRDYYAHPLHWDDAAHGPFGTKPPRSASWRNIRPTLPSAKALASAAYPPPVTRCTAHGIALPRPALPPPLRLHWLHVPKTGTSFGTTIMHRGCPRIPTEATADDGAPIVRLTERYPRRSRRWCDRGAFLGNLNGHEPVRYPEHRGRTVTMIREPRARLLSECAAIEGEFRRAFGTHGAAPPRRRLQRVPGRHRAGRHSAGHSYHRSHTARGHGVAVSGGASSGGSDRTGEDSDSDDTSWHSGSVYAQPFLREFLFSHGFSHAAIEALRRAWNRHHGSLPLHECIAVEGMRGCQAKMVIGIPCAAPFPLNASHMAEVRRRLAHDFLFVGLTERFEASVCLFHARLGGMPVAAQFLNSRPGGRAVSQLARLVRGSNASTTTMAGEHADASLVHELLVDKWDEEVYAAATTRFVEDLAAAQAWLWHSNDPHGSHLSASP